MRRLIYLDAAVDVVAKWFENMGLNGDICLDGLRSLPSAQPDCEYISRQAVTESDLIDWYINSVDESEPVWTEEHIHELFNDFYLIPKED